MMIAPQIAPSLILMATILSCWCERVWLTGFLTLAALAAGLYTGGLTLVALPVLGALGLSGLWLAEANRPVVRVIAAMLFIILSIGLASHVIPGFNNVLVWDQQVVKTASAPFTLYYNIDKPWVGLVLLLIVIPLIKTSEQWSKSFTKSAIPVLIMLPVLFVAGLTSGFIRWQPEWPQLGLWFLVNNLIFTAMAEEAFFRGFIQKSISEHLAKYSLSPFIGIMIASLLFGLAHYAGGIVYVGLASLAGFFYGWVYHRSGSIEMAIVSHWLLNTCHFVLFSFPVAV